VGTKASLILKANDVAATAAWYELVGFEVRGSFPDDAPTWVEVARDDLAVQSVSGDTPWPEPPRLTGCLYVRPPSVRAVHDEVKDRVECPWGVEERPWGARELTLTDPNGYYVTFTEPLDAGGS
jgi:hypothetical protein